MLFSFNFKANDFVTKFVIVFFILILPLAILLFYSFVH